MKNNTVRIFEIPVNDLGNDYDTLYYAPLSRRISVFPIEETDDDILPVSINSISNLRKMSVLPNHKCNFNCSYCYAAQGRNNEELTEETVTKALDFFIDRNRINRPLSLSILGGGEPVLSWAVTRQTIEYARERASLEGLHIEITLVTNASIVNDEIIQSVKNNDVIVNASFDLTEDAQNAQRKNFAVVKENISKLSESGVYTTINSTITPMNVSDMVKMVESAHEWFPKVKYMIFEPVIASSLFTSVIELRSFYENFLSNFNSASEKARQFGMDLTCRILKSLDSPTDRGCEGRFNLCPNGDVTICYCTASKNDPNFENRIFGKIDHTGIRFYEERFKRICEENVYSKNKCLNCFAKFNCAGGCMLPNDRYSEQYLEELCKFNREFIRRELFKRVAK